MTETTKTPDGSTLSPVERAAIVLLSMGEEPAAAVLRCLSREELLEVTQVMSRMSGIKVESVKHSIQHFFEDYRQQIGQMRKMGGIAGLVDKLPAELKAAAASAQVDEKRIGRLEGIINSMTPAERAKPELIKASRKRRIAAGAGVPVQAVNQLLAQFEQAQKMMKMVAKGGLAKMMRGMRGMMPGR